MYSQRQVMINAQVSFRVIQSALIGTCKNSLYSWPIKVCSAVLDFGGWPVPQGGEMGREPVGKAGCSQDRSYCNSPCLLFGLFTRVNHSATSLCCWVDLNV